MPKISEETRFRLDFAQRLRAARRGSGWDDVPEFAKQLGIKVNTYRRYEALEPEKVRGFPMHKITKLCELTGFPAWYFLSGQHSEPAHATKAAFRPSGSD